MNGYGESINGLVSPALYVYVYVGMNPKKGNAKMKEYTVETNFKNDDGSYLWRTMAVSAERAIVNIRWRIHMFCSVPLRIIKTDYWKVV